MRAVVMLLFCSAIPGFAQECRTILGHQAPDIASLQRVEDKWNDAFLHGHTDYLECLLAPNYISVSPKGTHDRAWELEHARQNQGSTTPIPQAPGIMFLVHGNTGLMRISKPASPDGKHPADYLSDIFAFENGAWHAVYSQHTTIQPSAGMAR